jgi:hypothetical protein
MLAEVNTSLITAAEYPLSPLAIANFEPEVYTVDVARILRKLLAARAELHKTPPRTDVALGELNYAIQEVENGPVSPYPDDGPLLRGQGPTSRIMGNGASDPHSVDLQRFDCE